MTREARPGIGGLVGSATLGEDDDVAALATDGARRRERCQRARDCLSADAQLPSKRRMRPSEMIPANPEDVPTGTGAP